jgi:hypothetical protein
MAESGIAHASTYGISFSTFFNSRVAIEDTKDKIVLKAAPLQPLMLLT